jgi:hypothetical protein
LIGEIPAKQKGSSTEHIDDYKDFEDSMSNPDVQELLHDVEHARAKLADNLSRLRAPSTHAEFTSALKEEAINAKGLLIEKTKSGVRSTFEGLAANLKAKAAANPAAALAIGAGIAWRLYQRPPIATALIGTGLISLLRTAPTATNGQTGDYLSHAAERLTEQVSDVGGMIKEEAVAAVDAIKGQTAILAKTANERLGQLADPAQGLVQNAVPNAGAHAAFSAEQLSHVAENVSRPVQNVLSDQESRDKLLLGVAGAAVVAALGIAFQRRLNEGLDAA